MKKLTVLILVSPVLWFAVGGCASEKSSNPLSPSVAGPIPGVSITPPKPLEPRDGVNIAVDQQPITLLLENAETTGVRPLTYTFEVATDTGFTNKVFVREGIAPGDAGRTALRLPDPLGAERTYYWRAHALDGANTGPDSGAAHFNIFTPIVIEKPTPREPVGNVRLASYQPKFKILNAPRSGPVGTISYVLELSDTDTFANKVAIWTFLEQPGETRFEAPHDLVPDKQYFWHVRAYDERATGPWSDTQVFRTADPPDPGPGPRLPGQPCGPPYPNQPFGVVECRRSQHSAHMDRSETVVFLREVARDLNAAGMSGGPFGILRKTSGNNCEGYSCDIICASWNIWDVLSDWDGAQAPMWGSKNGAPASTCEIQ